MKINVKAKPNSREEKVERLDDSNYIISVKEPPVRGVNSNQSQVLEAKK